MVPNSGFKFSGSRTSEETRGEMEGEKQAKAALDDVEKEEGEGEEEEEEEEYVMLDLDEISVHIPIPANAPYVLSGLDTLNPILTIDNKIKLIGEYEETIGTCFVFAESEAAAPVNEASVSAEARVNPRRCKTDPQQIPGKQINPVASLTRILKFRRLLEADSVDGKSKQDHEKSLIS